MSEISNSDCAIASENSHLKEQEMLQALRIERNNIIKEKVKNEYSMNFIEDSSKAYEEEIQHIAAKQTALEVENKQLKELLENETPTKLNLAQEVDNMSNFITVFSEQIDQLKNTLQVIDTNIEYTVESKKQLQQEAFQCIKDLNIKNKNLELKLNELESILRIETENLNQVHERHQNLLDDQNKEMLLLTKQEENLFAIHLEKRNSYLKITEEIEYLKNIQTELKNKFIKSQEKYAESINIFNSEKSKLVNKIEMLETDITNKNQLKIKTQNEIKVLKDKNNMLDANILQMQNEIQDLENQEMEYHDKNIEISSKLNDLNEKKLNVEEKSKEFVKLTEELKFINENFKKLQESNVLMQKEISNKEDNMKILQEQCHIKSQKIIELTSVLQNINKNKLELTQKYDNEKEEYRKKINEIDLKNKEKEEENKKLRYQIKEKEILVSEIKDKIEMNAVAKIIKFEKLYNILNTKKDKLKSLRKENEKLKSELKVNKEKIHNEIKMAENNYEEKLNKMKIEMKKYEDNINTIIKNENNNYTTEKKSLDDSIQSLLLQVSEQKICKENLQNEIGLKIKEILDVTNQIENIDNEMVAVEENKNVQTNVFKSPILLTNNKVKNRKSILKKQSDNIPLTQKSSADTNTATLKSKSVEKNEIESTKLKKVSIWSSDTETSDDYNKSSKQQSSKRKSTWPADDLLPLTQKQPDPLKKQDVYNYDSEGEKDAIFNSLKCNEPTDKKTDVRTPQQLKKSVTEFWGKGSDSSDDMFFGKLNKSKKIQMDLKTNNNLNTINLDTSSSDF